MSAFLTGHASHPDWRMALAMAGAQIDAQQAAAEGSGAGPTTLGFVYLTDHYAPHARALLAALRERWRGVAWVGSVGIGVAASGVEYFDEPALALMLAPLPTGFRLDGVDGCPDRLVVQFVRDREPVPRGMD